MDGRCSAFHKCLFPDSVPWRLLRVVSSLRYDDGGLAREFRLFLLRFNSEWIIPDVRTRQC